MEDPFTCPADCGGGGGVGEGVCGDMICDPGEDFMNCPVDCFPVCGNGFCEPGEDPTSCAPDCGSSIPVCGDGICDPVEGPSCPADCGGGISVCGDGICDETELAVGICPEDCGP